MSPFLYRLLGVDPTPPNPGRDLANIRHASDRERIRARTRQLCRELNKPVPPVLEAR